MTTDILHNSIRNFYQYHRGTDVCPYQIFRQNCDLPHRVNTGIVETSVKLDNFMAGRRILSNMDSGRTSIFYFWGISNLKNENNFLLQI